MDNQSWGKLVEITNPKYLESIRQAISPMNKLDPSLSIINKYSEIADSFNNLSSFSQPSALQSVSQNLSSIQALIQRSGFSSTSATIESALKAYQASNIVDSHNILVDFNELVEKKSIVLTGIDFDTRLFFKNYHEVFILSNSLASILVQYPELRVLSKLSSALRLDDFPYDGVWNSESDNLYAEHELSDTIAELNVLKEDKLYSISSFNELSERQQNILLDLYHRYYYQTILYCLILFSWFKLHLDEKIDITNNIFIFVENTKSIPSYVADNIYRPNLSTIKDGLVTAGIIELIKLLIKSIS